MGLLVDSKNQKVIRNRFSKKQKNYVKKDSLFLCYKLRFQNYSH
jgi:hypothetical protein